MYVLAVHGPRDDAGLPAILAAVLDRSLAETTNRLRVPGTGPLVVAVLQDRAQTVDLGRRLQSAGFAVLALGPEHVETDEARMVVRSCALEGDTLSVSNRPGDTLQVPLPTVAVLLLGTSVTLHTEVTEERTRKLSLGRAALTGGLVGSKAVVKQVSSESQTRERFAYLHAPGLPTVALRESALQSVSLDGATHASRAASFTHLVAALRRLCVTATADDRLLNRGAQAMLLGPVFTPEDHLDVATTLLVRSLRS